MDNVIYSWRQRLTQWYIYIPLLLLMIVISIINYNDSGVDFYDLVPVYAIIIMVILLLYSFSISVKMYKDYLLVKPSWFSNKYIYHKSVQKIVIGEYRFVGFGVRFDTEIGDILNVKGNKGALFVMDSKNILVGIKDISTFYNAISGVIDKEKIIVLDSSTKIQDFMKQMIRPTINARRQPERSEA